MTKKHIINPIDPTANIAVSASAGTGKTYLLVNRIVRLLIEGVEPENILAITFTRKAANEMLARVQNRVWQLRCYTIEELKSTLENEFCIKADKPTITRVQHLHETLLLSETRLKISTFHAFCQDLLQHFALDAGLPPNFELIEQTYLLADAAWDTLFSEITENKNHSLRPAVDNLFEHLGSLYSTRAALLDGFLEHRTDWWSFTEKQKKPITYATQVAWDFFQPTEHNPENDFLKKYKNRLIELSKKIQHLEKAPYKNIANAISKAFDEIKACEKPFLIIKESFLTSKNTIRILKPGKTFEKDFGSNADNVLNEYTQIATAITSTLDNIKRNKLYLLHKSWYEVGNALLEHYQKIKRNRHQLDFNDLEWTSYKLISETENAQWIQYKLDNRINHLLIDEFQDTNSTQWQMLLPLLQEMASGNTDRQRSVFIVGDTKQSIYAFRRANPELQATATQWLQEHLQASTYPLSKSWRSSPAVMQAVNSVFLNQNLLADFCSHGTYKDSLWGHIEYWPLFSTPEDSKEKNTDFRNPLISPLNTQEHTAHKLEAEAIAKKIAELINDQIGVTENNRIIEYQDILILLRNRTHAKAYEDALNIKGIPYTGTETGTLLECQEVDDIICLLNFLVTPYDNLGLAQLIKSPIFNGTDADLIQLAQINKGSWLEKLQSLYDTNHANTELSDAYIKLTNWSQQQHLLPVHDLLNLIYHEGDILERYHTAMPKHLKSRAKANLQYLLELALNIDSGRYPSIMRFLHYIEKLKSAKDNQKPDSLREQENQNRVRIMTIHAAKGLEAPVVFLADAHTNSAQQKPYSCFTDWPTNENKVKNFFLLPKKEDIPECLSALNQQAEQKSKAEDNNLLYVAMTRAIHMLFVSGCENSRAKGTWYEKIQNTFSNNIIEHGTIKKGITIKSKSSNTIKKILPKKINAKQSEKFINPSLHSEKPVAHTTSSTKNKAAQRGNFIHHALACISENRKIHYPEHFQADKVKQDTLQEWQEEARKLINKADLHYLYASNQYEKAYNEVPILIKTEEGLINGIIDRLLVDKEKIIIIDYKTHTATDNQQLKNIANSYQPQMNLYKDSIKRLYPNKHYSCLIVFTYSQVCYEV